MSAALNANEQRELSQRLEKKQMLEFFTMTQNMVERCFTDCITDFSTKSLQSKEEGCISRCVDVRFKAAERIGSRFAELTQAMGQGQQQQ